MMAQKRTSVTRRRIFLPALVKARLSSMYIIIIGLQVYQKGKGGDSLPEVLVPKGRLTKDNLDISQLGALDE